MVLNVIDKKSDIFYSCFDCADSKEAKVKGGIHTWHTGKCDICHEEKSITSVRHWVWKKTDM